METLKQLHLGIEALVLAIVTSGLLAAATLLPQPAPSSEQLLPRSLHAPLQQASLAPHRFQQQA